MQIHKIHKLTQVCYNIEQGGATVSGKTSTASKRLYNEKAYDRISLVVKKGRKEELKAYAESKGMSINGYINKLIDEDMKTADKE